MCWCLMAARYYTNYMGIVGVDHAVADYERQESFELLADCDRGRTINCMHMQAGLSFQPLPPFHPIALGADLHPSKHRNLRKHSTVYNL